MSDDVRLFNGDCLDLLRDLPDGSVDAVITDPPYSSGGAFRSDRANKTASKYLGNSKGTTAGLLSEVVGDSRDALGWAFWATLWLTRCYAALRPGGFLLMFSDWRQLPNATNVVQAAGFVWRGIAVWDKGASARPMCGRFSHRAEYVVWATKGPIPWDYARPALQGLYQAGTVPGAKRSHQTEKPEDVMAWLVDIVEPGSTVLDPFMGSGTTGVVCAQTGRKFIGYECDPTYFAVAERRIAEARMQLPLPMEAAS